MDKPPRITWRGDRLHSIKSRHFKYYQIAKDVNAEVIKVAEARKEIIEFVLLYQKIHDISLSSAVRMVHERIVIRKLPPHLVDAVLIANARPHRFGAVTISTKTLFRWIRAYRLADGDKMALAPTPTKSLYANTNAKIRVK